MENTKLELRHLSPYLPYGLKLHGNTHGAIETLSMLSESAVYIESQKTTSYGAWADLFEVKPILRPLSEYQDINGSAMRSINIDLMDQIKIQEFASKHRSLANLSYWAYIALIEDKADVFNLIDQNLAISINTLKTTNDE